MEPVIKNAVIAVTEKGARLASLIAYESGFDFFLPTDIAQTFGATPYHSLKDCFTMLMNGTYKGIVGVMAQGILTRMTAPHLRSKYVDPAVVTCDEVGRFAISSISGHEGGANKLAHFVSSITGAVPVITTATEANRKYIIGIGCKKNTPKHEIIHAIQGSCALANIDVKDLRLAASAWIKKSETGLLEAVDELKIYIRFLPEKAYKNPIYKFTEYETPMKHFGIPGVAEPSALLCGNNPELILHRTVMGSVTTAIVKEGLHD